MSRKFLDDPSILTVENKLVTVHIIYFHIWKLELCHHIAFLFHMIHKINSINRFVYLRHVSCEVEIETCLLLQANPGFKCFQWILSTTPSWLLLQLCITTCSSIVNTVLISWLLNSHCRSTITASGWELVCSNRAVSTRTAGSGTWIWVRRPLAEQPALRRSASRNSPPQQSSHKTRNTT
jgi:hypothetical protein